jgi:hypothetical protein
MTKTARIGWSKQLIIAICTEEAGPIPVSGTAVYAVTLFRIIFRDFLFSILNTVSVNGFRAPAV